MVSMLARHWWVIAMQGITAIAFGMITLFWPILTLRALILIFGIYAAIDGVLAVVGTIVAAGRRQQWAGLLLHGLVGIAVGALVLAYPGVTTLFLLYAVAGWTLAMGVYELVAAGQLRRVIHGDCGLSFVGILSIVLAVLLVISPGSGAIGLAGLIAAYAVVAGFISVAAAFRVRTRARSLGLPEVPQS